MIDASARPLAENIAATRRVVEYSHPRAVEVEADPAQDRGRRSDLLGEYTVHRAAASRNIRRSRRPRPSSSHGSSAPSRTIPPGWPLKTEDELQYSGFACTGGAGDETQITFLNVQGNIPDSIHRLMIDLRDVIKNDHLST
jgi:hypothetical protein